jgi:reactive chlorine resistance protein C
MNNFEKTGFYIALYGVAIILIWIGIFKFTPTEAKAIKPLVENSPLMRWMYNYMSELNVSKLIGILEIITGVLLASYPISAKMGLVGGIMSSLTFLTTLSFLFTTPGAIQKIDGIWLPDAFILKDIMALGISIYITALAARQLSE